MGERNIYGNLQEVEVPELLDFDLENRKLWKPFNEKDDEEYPDLLKCADSHGGKECVLPDEKLKYFGGYAQRLTELEGALTKYLKDKFAEQRLQDTKKMINWNVDFAGGEDFYKLLAGDFDGDEI